MTTDTASDRTTFPLDTATTYEIVCRGCKMPVLLSKQDDPPRPRNGDGSAHVCARRA